METCIFHIFDTPLPVLHPSSLRTSTPSSFSCLQILYIRLYLFCYYFFILLSRYLSFLMFGHTCCRYNPLLTPPLPYPSPPFPSHPSVLTVFLYVLISRLACYETHIIYCYGEVVRIWGPCNRVVPKSVTFLGLFGFALISPFHRYVLSSWAKIAPQPVRTVRMWSKIYSALKHNKENNSRVLTLLRDGFHGNYLAQL